MLFCSHTFWIVELLSRCYFEHFRQLRSHRLNKKVYYKSLWVLELTAVNKYS